MEFIIGQLISMFVLIIAVISAQFKNIKHILIGDITANLTIALSYALLGGLSGAWMCVIATVQGIVIYFANQKSWQKGTRNIITVIFAAAYITGTILVIKGWKDIVSCLSSMLFVLAIVQESASKYRSFKLLNNFFLIVYDISTAAYVNAITHGMQLISLITAKLRLDRKSKEDYK